MRDSLRIPVLHDPTSVSDSSVIGVSPARTLTGLSTRLDKAISAGLLGTLVVTALAHGAVEPWSVALFELMLIALLVLWGIKIILDRQLHLTIPAVTFPIFALLLLGIAQSFTWTSSTGDRVSLSTDVEATRHAVTILFFLAASFLMAANFLMTKDRLFLLANFLTVFGAMMAVFALIQFFSWNHRLYWLRTTDNAVFGPFVNHNNFAGYMAMITPVPVALILSVVRGHARLIYGSAAALMGTAVIISGSRSGVFSLAAALIFMAFLNRRSLQRGAPNRLSAIGPIAIVAVAIVAGVIWIGPLPVIEHFGVAVDELVVSGTPDVGRASIWQDTMGMIRNYPVLGAGLGSYQTIYPAYGKTQGLDYAHNDYLQVVAEFGVAGVLIVGWFIVMILIAIPRGIRSSDPLFNGVSLAAGAGIMAVIIQSLSDTDLQIPSNALLFLVLCAVVTRVSVPEVVLLRNGLEELTDAD